MKVKSLFIRGFELSFEIIKTNLIKCLFNNATNYLTKFFIHRTRNRRYKLIIIFPND
jgi:hypothetical protein